MKKHLMIASALVLAFAGLSTASENALQPTSQPGQLTAAADLAIRPSVAIKAPATRFDTAENSHRKTVNRLWIASMCSVAASTSMDAATSWGKREGNSFLASSNGTFGERGVSIKAGMLAAVVVPQILFRHHQDLKSKFAIGNFVEAGIFTGVSIHNLGISAPRQ